MTIFGYIYPVLRLTPKRILLTSKKVSTSKQGLYFVKYNYEIFSIEIAAREKL